jgi:hypothetical protein
VDRASSTNRAVAAVCAGARFVSRAAPDRLLDHVGKVGEGGVEFLDDLGRGPPSGVVDRRGAVVADQGFSTSLATTTSALETRVEAGT